MSKKQKDSKKIFTRIMAGVLALLMLLGICATVIFYLIGM